MKNPSAIKWINQKTRSQRFKMWMLILANAFFSALSVAFAFAVKGVIDGATSTDAQVGKRTLIISAIVLGVIVVLQFVFRLIINGLSEHLRGKIDVALKSSLFSQILKKKYSTVTKYHSGELMTRLTNDVSAVSDGMVSIVPTAVAAIVRLLLAVVALVILAPIFSVAFLIAGISVFIILGLIRGKLKSLHKDVQQTEGTTRSFMQESIENMLAIKVFSANDKIESRADQLQSSNFKVKMHHKNYSVLGHASYNIIFSMGYIFALIYGGVMLFNGTLQYGALSAILQLVNNIQVPFASISNVFPKYYSMLASAERIMEIENFEDEPEQLNFDKIEVYSKLKSIELKDVTFAYDRDTVLENASFTVNKGDFVAITGISGIGKSTMLKLILGVFKPTVGRLDFNLADGKMDVDSTTRRLFSYVPQGNFLFSGTLRDNVTFIAPEVTDEQINKALEISCSSQFVKELPNGIDTVVGEKGIGLSEGQIQRIAIARAILSESPIILLDEATSALDEITEAQLLQNLKSLMGVTLITVSHRKSTLDICNRKVEVVGKKLVERTLG